jgi:hypothetical protein
VGAVPPIAWGKFADAVLKALLPMIGALVGRLISQRYYQRKFRKTVETVSRDFARERPEVSLVLGQSPADVAAQLADFFSQGALPAARSLGQEWAVRARLDPRLASELAGQYLERLQRALSKSAGLRKLFESGANIQTAAAAQRMAQMMWDEQVQQLEKDYLTAAAHIVRAAFALVQGDLEAAWYYDFEAGNKLAEATLCRDWKLLQRSKDIRGWLSEQLEGPFQELKAARQRGDDIRPYFKSVERGHAAFQARVTQPGAI